MNSEKTISFGMQDGKPIEWQVIAENHREKVLLSKFILDAMPFNETDDVTEWSESSLYDYLNSDFVNEHFNEKEREQLLFINDDDNGVVTMLTLDNLIDLYGDIHYADGDYYNNLDQFGANINMVAKPLDRALYNEIEIYDNGVFAEIMGKGVVDKRFDFANGNSPYWLLNKAESEDNIVDNNYIYYVTPTGYIDCLEPSRLYIGIRPIIRIRY